MPEQDAFWTAAWVNHWLALGQIDQIVKAHNDEIASLLAELANAKFQNPCASDLYKRINQLLHDNAKLELKIKRLEESRGPGLALVEPTMEGAQHAVNDGLRRAFNYVIDEVVKRVRDMDARGGES